MATKIILPLRENDDENDAWRRDDETRHDEGFF